MNNEINYLKEHLYEIYQYKKSMKDLTYDMDIELLLRVSKALHYQQQRIDKAIKIYENCIKTNDFSTCDLDMYEILKGENNE